MPTDQTLSIVIKLQDEASAALQAMQDKVQAVASGVGSSLSSAGSSISSFGESVMSAGQKMQSVGQGMTVGLTLPIVALGKTIIDTSMRFEASMQLIQTQAGASAQEVQKMTTAVLALARSGDTGQGPQALADGLFHLESLGLRGSAAMDALKVSAEGADVGLADMEGVTNALGAAMVTGISGTQSAEQAMGILNATIGAGNMKMDDLTAALGTGILPAAKNFGLTLQDVGAALATLTDNGMRADESATRLRMTFSLMAAPTAKAKGALADIGLGAYQLANDMRQPNGLVTAIEDLNTHLQASGETATEQAATLSAAFGGGRTSAAILTLTQQIDRLKNKYDEIGSSAGNFAAEVEATHETNLFKLNAALSSMQATLIDIGGTLLPLFATALQKVSQAVSAMAAWWDRLSPSMRNFIAIALAIVAALGPVIYIIGTITTAIGFLIEVVGGITSVIGFLATAFAGLDLAAAPVLLVVAAVVLLGLAAYEMWKNWSTVSAFFKAMWVDLKNATKVAIDFIVGLVVIFLNYMVPGWQDALAKIVQIWTDAWNSIKEFFDSIGKTIEDSIGAVFDWITSKIQSVIDAWNSMLAIIGKPIQTGFGAVGSALGAVGGVISKAASSVVSTGAAITHFETGGFVNAPRGTAVPAILHGGEEIVSAENSANGSRRGGNNVYLTINNPSIRTADDLRQLKKDLDTYFRPLFNNAKLVHV
jgi:TP901 family phage tail tape measure protein